MGGNKQLITIMNKLNHSISYPTVQKQNKAWSEKVTTKHSMFSSMRKGVVTHSTMDNNDGRQESVTGAGTTHDTNQTLFQLPTLHEIQNIPQIEDESEAPMDIGNTDDSLGILDVPNFNIGKLSEPPLFKKGIIEKRIINCPRKLF